MRRLFLLIISILIFSVAIAQKNNASTAKVKTQVPDARVADYVKAEIHKWKIPGVAFAVIKNNKIITEGYFGFANLDHKVPVSRSSVFPIASVDKQIIATCIMMLFEKDLLKLNDPINKFLDSLPGDWSDIQIRHLLSHTSGLPNESIERFKGQTRIVNTTEEIFENIKKQKLQSTPGDNFLYSDAGYFLLALIVQKVSGINYESILQKNIFEPLGMTSTALLKPRKITQGRVTSYYKNNEGEILINTHRSMDSGPLWTDIGTTIRDFIKYDSAINSNALLKSFTYKEMWTPFVTNSGSAVSNLLHEKKILDADASYGYGWELQNFRNHKIVYHSGFTGVSITKLLKDSLTVIFFANLTDRDGYRANIMARHIAAFYVPGSHPSGLKVKKDPSTSTTEFIKKEIIKLNKGLAEKDAFSPKFLSALEPALPQYKELVNKWGELQVLQYLDSEMAADNKKQFYYKAIYKNGVVYYHLSLISDGKIDFLSVQR